MRGISILFSLLILLGFTACKDQSVKDQDLIEQYIEDNNLNTEVTQEGLHYIIHEACNSTKPNIATHYTIYAWLCVRACVRAFLSEGSCRSRS